MANFTHLSVVQTHSNETVGSIRWKISEHLSCPVDNVQIFANDSVVSVDDSVQCLSGEGLTHVIYLFLAAIYRY